MKIKAKECKGKGRNRRCRHNKIVVKKRSEPAEFGRRTVYDEGSKKVMKVFGQSNIPLDIININEPGNEDIIEKYNIKAVPTLITLDGETIEGSEEIIEKFSPILSTRHEIREVG